MTITVVAPVEPSGIDAAGKGALLFVPAIANINAPTLTELAAGENISCKLYAWAPKGEQGKVTRTRYCSTAENESLGRVKYSAEDIQYDYDPQKPTEATGEYSLYAKMQPGLSGYIVDRRGLDARSPWAAGQFVDVYPVTLGVRNRDNITTEEGRTLSVTQAVAIFSDPAFDVAIKADAA